jgi:hypothetical protein
MRSVFIISSSSFASLKTTLLKAAQSFPDRHVFVPVALRVSQGVRRQLRRLRLRVDHPCPALLRCLVVGNEVRLRRTWR